jgi:hypothetical protein
VWIADLPSAALPRIWNAPRFARHLRS